LEWRKNNAPSARDGTEAGKSSLNPLSLPCKAVALLYIWLMPVSRTVESLPPIINL